MIFFFKPRTFSVERRKRRGEMKSPCSEEEEHQEPSNTAQRMHGEEEDDRRNLLKQDLGKASRKKSVFKLRSDE